MGLAHEKKSYLQEKAKLFEIGSILSPFVMTSSPPVFTIQRNKTK